jgi:predicted membrane metal-binding protein
MKLMRLVVVFVCVALGFYGIVYNVLVLPFSSPLFDLISWLAIGAAMLVLWLIGQPSVPDAMMGTRTGTELEDGSDAGGRRR